MMSKRIVVAMLLGVVMAGCSRKTAEPAPVVGQEATEQGQAEARLAELRDKPLYEFDERDVDLYLRQLHRGEQDFRRRIVHLARKGIDQPYELYLLGESPFETIDDQPIYCLDRSDCVVFAEHMIAMSLADNWPAFLAMLQRIRYQDGHISVVTRNHYTEADWNRNNEWLLRDITDELAGDAVIRFTQRVDRARFLKNRYKLEREIPVQTIEESFIPYKRLDSVKPLLRDGDVVNFVTGRGEGFWVGHVGLIGIGTDGTVNLIHSAEPKVREEPMDAYVARATREAEQRDAEGKARFRGFKFLRIHEDALARLRAVDGAGAPRVTIPAESTMTWEEYLRGFEVGG